MGIPRRIHYCWYGGTSLPPLQRACVDGWAERLPGWEIVRWDESNTRFDNDFLRAARRRRQWAFVADYVRMRVLHEQGGVYLDTDIELVRDLTPLLDAGAFLGEEARRRPNTAVLGCVAGHPFPRACLEILADDHARGRAFRIAPEVAAAALAALPPGSVTVHPPEAFYPYNPYDTERPVAQLLYRDIGPRTYAIHHWAKSWHLGPLQRLRRALRRLLERR